MRPALPALALAVAGAVLVACSDAGPPPDPVGQPTADPTSAPTTAEPIVGSWEPGAAPVDLPGGWQLSDCEGDAPLLCIDRDGETVGLLMASSFPLPAELAAATDAEARAAALRAFATGSTAGVAEDRAIGCGDGYRFAAEEVADVTVGGLPGVRYGFTGTERGAVTEHVRSFATVAGGQLWIVTAEAASPDGCMASDEIVVFHPEEFGRFLPVLDRVVAGTPLPGAGTRIEDGAVVGVDGGLDGGLVYVIVGGHKQRVQQPRPTTAGELAAAGVRIGAAVARIEVAGAPTGSQLVVVPPDGPDARLHLVVAGVAYPVVIQSVSAEAIAGMPEIDPPVLHRLRPAG